MNPSWKTMKRALRMAPNWSPAPSQMLEGILGKGPGHLGGCEKLGADFPPQKEKSQHQKRELEWKKYC